MIKQELPIIICNICGKEVQTTSASQNYKMAQFSIAHFYQNGSGASAYQLDRQKKGDACLDCYAKMVDESPTFKAFLNSMK